MTALVFMDTETTGLSLDDDIWEFAAIRREQDGSERIEHLFIEHDPLRCQALPESFLADHKARFPYDEHWRISSRAAAADRIARLFDDRPHVVGAVPNFDTERLALLLSRHGFKPGWHYHLIDVENLAVGWLYGRFGWMSEDVKAKLPTLPWDSDELSKLCGVEPPTDERHTALGDARWAMRLYDAITGPR